MFFLLCSLFFLPVHVLSSTTFSVNEWDCASSASFELKIFLFLFLFSCVSLAYIFLFHYIIVYHFWTIIITISDLISYFIFTPINFLNLVGFVQWNETRKCNHIHHCNFPYKMGIFFYIFIQSQIIELISRWKFFKMNWIKLQHTYIFLWIKKRW